MLTAIQDIELGGCSPETERAVAKFLYRQSEILDNKRWQAYIDLFDDDGIYWSPADPKQVTGDGEVNIFWEDKDFMTIRMNRLGHPHAWSQMTSWGTSHVIGNIEAEERKDGTIYVRSRFHMMEYRRDESRQFAGVYQHILVKKPEGFKIKLQRCDLVNGEGPYEYVLQAWV